MPLLSTLSPETQPAPQGAGDDDVGYARDDDYARWFAAVAAQCRPGAALRRLALHLDAELDGPQRLALWQALAHAHGRAGAAERQHASAALDGRYAAALAALQLPADDPARLQAICTHTPEAARAGFVPLLLAQAGLDPWSPGRCPPALVMLAARAATDADRQLTAARRDTLQAAAMAAVEVDPPLLPHGLALLFELALQAGDETNATAVLAEAIGHGHSGALRADRVRAWLDGTATLPDGDDDAHAGPLRLAPALQRVWLHLPRWRHRSWLSALHRALQRGAPRERLRQLAAALPPGDDADPAVDASAWPALQTLERLDRAYALAATGDDPLPPLRGRLHKDMLAPPALAAVQRARARAAAARGDMETQVLALLQARRQRAPEARWAELAPLLPAPAPAAGAPVADEQAYWQGLLTHPDARWQRLARRQLITLWTDGQWQPRALRREAQRPRDAMALWQSLVDDPLHGASARAALARPELVLAAGAEGDDGCLWFETPGATQVFVVFSCVASHHGWPEVAALHGQLPGHHLLFVRCPEKNWYCDDAYDRVHAALRRRVADRFAPEAVCTWYGSMGGHGAWKFALAFGWRTIVFNPQTDLDLWAAFRPRERALLQGARRHSRLTDQPLQAWQRTPVYIACGSATPDRAALSVAVARWRQCRHLDLIVEKFDDDNHAGLMHRIAGGAVPAALLRIARRLQQLPAAPVLQGPGLAAAAAAGFWDALDDARTAKVEIQVRDGQLWWQPSLASGTR